MAKQRMVLCQTAWEKAVAGPPEPQVPVPEEKGAGPEPMIKTAIPREIPKHRKRLHKIGLVLKRRTRRQMTKASRRANR